MGLFDKLKGGMDQAKAAADLAAQQATQAPAPGQIGVSGMPVNPAAFGGPSTAPLAADDPMLAPIEGIGLPEYASVARAAQQRGVTTQEGMNAIAAEQGLDPEVFDRASKEWVARMGQSMVVGQEFRRHLGM